MMICYGYFKHFFFKKKKLKQDAIFFVFVLFLETVSVVLASPELKNIPTSASLILEIKLCTTMPS